MQHHLHPSFLWRAASPPKALMGLAILGPSLPLLIHRASQNTLFSKATATVQGRACGPRQSPSIRFFNIAGQAGRFCTEQCTSKLQSASLQDFNKFLLHDIINSLLLKLLSVSFQAFHSKESYFLKHIYIYIYIYIYISRLPLKKKFQF